MKLDRPILVTGTPRAGKSVVARMLALAPEIQYVYEPFTIWDTNFGNRNDDLRSAEEVSDQLRDCIVSGCCELLTEPGKHRYVDALSYHALRLPFVHRILPDAKIIHVLRDPIDVIPEMLFGWTYRDTVGKALARRRKDLKWKSLPLHAIRFANNYVLSRLKGRRATWGPRVPELSNFTKSHSIAEVAAYQWMKMVEIALADLANISTEQWLEVRYDNLLDSPQIEAKRIAEFCEIDDIGHFVMEAESFVDPNVEFEKKVQPTADEWKAISKLILPLQIKLGYKIAAQESQN